MSGKVGIGYEQRFCLVWEGVWLQEAAEDVPQPALHKRQIGDVASQQSQVKPQAGDICKGNLHHKH